MSHNRLFTEDVAVLGTIDPAAAGTGTTTTGWVDLSIWHKVGLLVMAGTLGASATLNAKLEQSGPTAGANTKDVTGKLITALTQAGTDSNKQSWINCRADELDKASTNNFRYVRGSMTVGVAASGASMVLLGIDCKYGPANANDATTVDEIVA